MVRLRITLAFLFCLTCAAAAKADPVIVPVPIDTPVFVSITANPLVRIGPITFDFTASSNNEFIGFRPFELNIGTIANPVYRFTIGIRARDGLASLSGVFPTSPVNYFSNTLPTFTVGMTDLILFDLIVAGYGTPYTLTITDMNGDIRNANFSTSIPEPTTIILLGTGLAGAAASRRRRKRNL